MKKDPFESKKQASGMNVPEGYFAEFHKKMVSDISLEQQKQEVKRNTLTIYMRRAMYFAAMITGLLFTLNIVSDSENDIWDIDGLTFVSDIVDMEKNEYINLSVSEYELYEYLYAKN